MLFSRFVLLAGLWGEAVFEEKNHHDATWPCALDQSLEHTSLARAHRFDGGLERAERLVSKEDQEAFHRKAILRRVRHFGF